MTSTPDTSVAESQWERYAVTLIEAHYPCPPDRLARQQSRVRAGASFLIPDATVYDGVEHLRTHGRVQCPKCGSVLITTTIRRLGSQLDTRLFMLEARDDPQQVQDALDKQGAIELEGLPEPDPALIAARAPRRVHRPVHDGLGR